MSRELELLKDMLLLAAGIGLGLCASGIVAYFGGEPWHYAIGGFLLAVVAWILMMQILRKVKNRGD